MDNSFYGSLLSYYPWVCVILGLFTSFLAVLSALGSFSTFHKALFKHERFHFYYTVRFIFSLCIAFHYYDLYYDMDSTLPEIMVDPREAFFSMTFSLIWPFCLLTLIGYLILKLRPEERDSLLFKDWPTRLWRFLTNSRHAHGPMKIRRHPGQLVAVIIGKDPNTNRLVRHILETEKFVVAEAMEGAEGLSLAAFNYPDLVVLDLRLPDMDGELVLRHLREWTQAPALVLNSNLSYDEIAEKSELNHDHYLSAPLSATNLKETLTQVLRQILNNDQHKDQSIYQTSIFKLEQNTRTLTVRNKEVHLTPHEFHLLSYMTKHPGQVITLKMLRHEFWGRNMDEEALRRYIHNLRYKIELDPVMPKYILTEPGLGYRLQNR